MLQMSQYYEPEFKKKIVRLHIEEGGSLKSDYHQKKDEIKNSIREIYHSHGGVDGYRTVHAYPVRKGYDISRLTVHKYMNTEMQLFSISRKKKPAYEHVIAHKVYENKLKIDVYLFVPYF